MPMTNRIAEFYSEIAEWRQDIHQHPELMFATKRTGELVAEKLREFGCDEVVTGMAQNGVVGIIRGKPAADGRVVGLRADMDALPIHETTNLPYASKTSGIMHACGHDGHTAMLLGAARYLAETRNFAGAVAVIFQPAEEGGGGGEVMCREGLMTRFGIDEVYGMHNMPGIPVGEFAIRSGAFFAATDQFFIHVQGLGGHAAMPHTTADPVVVAAQMITALQTIASRNVDPLKQVVVSVCTVRTDSEATNVTPENVWLSGTVRTLDAEVRDLSEARVREIATKTAEVFGVTAKVDYERGYPVMINAERETQYAAAVAEQVSGKECRFVDPIMGGEDFAYMLEECPGAYILVGNGDTAALHHPEFNFSDEAIPAGASFWVQLVETRLPAR